MSLTIIRHEWLTALIRQVHAESRGTYASRRVRAELILGRGIRVSERLVWWLLHDAGTHRFPGLATACRTAGIPKSEDLVARRFVRSRLSAPWDSDTKEHPTRQGKVLAAAL